MSDARRILDKMYGAAIDLVDAFGHARRVAKLMSRRRSQIEIVSGRVFALSGCEYQDVGPDPWDEVSAKSQALFATPIQPVADVLATIAHPETPIQWFARLHKLTVELCHAWSSPMRATEWESHFAPLRDLPSLLEFAINNNNLGSGETGWVNDRIEAIASEVYRSQNKQNILRAIYKNGPMTGRQLENERLRKADASGMANVQVDPLLTSGGRFGLKGSRGYALTELGMDVAAYLFPDDAPHASVTPDVTQTA